MVPAPACDAGGKRLDSSHVHHLKGPMKQLGVLPMGKNTPVNVGVQRSSVDLKEAENVGEQAKSIADRYSNQQFQNSKHGLFKKTAEDHPVESMWN